MSNRILIPCYIFVRNKLSFNRKYIIGTNATLLSRYIKYAHGIDENDGLKH